MGGKCQVLAVGAMLAAASLPMAAHPAPPPRDAIRNLPRLSHTSELSSNSSSGTGQDFYNGVWRIDWLAADLRLGSASLRPSLSASTTLTENRDRISRSSSSGRQDWVNLRLDLRAPKLNGYAAFDQTDSTTSRGGTASQSTDRTTQSKEVSLQWAGPAGSSLYARHNSSLVNEHLGPVATSASEVQTSTFGAEYSPRAMNAPQSYKVQTTLTESDVYVPQRSKNSRRRTVFSGVRTLPLGKAGTLALDFNFDEQSVTLPGFAREQTTSEGNYGLSYFGRVDKLPLDYNYNFHTTFRDYADQPGERVTTSNLDMTYTMPAPPGRSSSLNFRYYTQDYEGAQSRSQNATQTLRWNFSASSRLNGNVFFQHDDNNSGFSPASQKDVLSGDLRYGLSHGRGDIGASFRQENTSDVANNSSSSTTAQVSTGFALGPQTRLQLFFDQQHTQNRLGRFGDPRSSDNFGSGFTYAFASRAGLGLVATWRHSLLETEPSGVRNTTDTLNVNMNFDAPTGWRYVLNLVANDAVKDSAIGGEHSYATESRIQAIVSYSF